MAPLGHIADIPAVGPELYSVISPKTLSVQSLEGLLLCRLDCVKAAESLFKKKTYLYYKRSIVRSHMITKENHSSCLTGYHVSCVCGGIFMLDSRMSVLKGGKVDVINLQHH